MVKPSGQDNRPVQYFLPGQLMFLCDHAHNLSANEVIDLLRRDPVFGKNPVLQESKYDAERVISFPLNQRDRASSIVPFMTPIQSSEALIRLVDSLDRRFSGLIYRCMGIFRHRRLTVTAVSPNWLSSGAPGLIGTGGPGAQPEPFTPGALPSSGRITGRFMPTFEFPLASILNKSSSIATEQGAPGESSPVEVAILDTAPGQEALQSAYENLHTQNPLIDDLLGPTGTLPSPKLRVNYAPRSLMAELDDPDPNKGYGLRDHQYPMSDHGLFATGIVHTIAPDAHLRLIQVLNDYGVGSLETIAYGLNLLLQERRDTKMALIINMSLVLSIPLKGHPRPDLHWTRLNNPAVVRRMGKILEGLCIALQNTGAAIVAAAGNDAEKHNRPGARFPAAFQSVVGVSALTNKGNPATYSNLADDPSRRGIATFGGAASNGTAQPGEAMLGLYIGNFPDGTPSANGWAWWAGTSFAAPVISGAFARLLERNVAVPSALSALYSAEPGVTPTPGQEEVITAKQIL